MTQASGASRSRRPKSGWAADADEDEELTPTKPARHCNVCDGVPEWRGLCAAHRQTHRGLADPKEDE